MTEHQNQLGIDAIFRQQVIKRGTSAAVICGPQALSYKALDRHVQILAAKLVANGIRREDPVGILLNMCPEHVICQLAILRAGGSCVPLDPSAPNERIHNMLEDVGAKLVLTTTNFQSRLGQIQSIILDADIADQEHSSVHLDLSDQLPGDHADHRTHILFTSGTTGRPKGVQILARGIIRLTVAPQYMTFNSNQRVAAINNPTFDPSQLEIWGALLNGGTSVMLPKQTAIDPFALRDTLRQQQITTLVTTTALFNQTVHACPDAFSGLFQVIFGGEAANVHTLRAVFKHGPPSHLFNVYGPTEVSAISLTHEITSSTLENDTVPIGKPIDHTQVFLLDEDQCIINSAGEVGEIYIGGSGLARGYFNRPEQNAERFLELDHLVNGQRVRVYRSGDLASRDEHGDFYFHGRNDHQVKIRGHRIEIKEIEAVSRASGFLQDALVTVQETKLGDKYLVEFIVGHRGKESEQDKQQLKAQIESYHEEKLPAYMRPRIVVLKSLPLNLNGKVDLKLLNQQWHENRANEEKSVANNPTINEGPSSSKSGSYDFLVALWRRLLDVHTVENDDDFFMIGGDSLKAARLATEISRHINYPFPVQALYRHSILSDLLHYIDKKHQSSESFSSVDDLSVLTADIILPDHIRQIQGTLHGWRGTNGGHVFLTGATGFLGAFVLRDLLMMPEVKQVICLVRANSDDEAMDRIRSNLTFYRLWNEEYTNRILPLKGDLSKDYLGLGKVRFDSLSASSDAVFHLGAHVNYIQPYATHRSANIAGTINILTFVTSGKPKSLHYVSTIATFGPVNLLKREEVLYEDADLLDYLTGLKYDTGYSQSQWVAEQLMWEASRRKVPIAVYRPGFIMGDSQTGAGNPKDFVARLIRGCLTLGCYPILPNQGKQFVTVDYVSQAILRIASDDDNLSRAFHLVPLRNDELTELFDLLDQCGRPLKGVPYSQWVQCLKDSPGLDTNQLMPFISMLSEPVYGHLTRWETYENMPIYDTSNTKKALEKTGGLELPQIDHVLLQKYMDFWTSASTDSKVDSYSLSEDSLIYKLKEHEPREK
ncbi:hypothetical protein FBU30_004550 [Linnemannia zychae]|nr:hypothetical protein FBU30_004550 [Linnemannia zychae]